MTEKTTKIIKFLNCNINIVRMKDYDCNITEKTKITKLLNCNINYSQPYLKNCQAWVHGLSYKITNYHLHRIPKQNVLLIEVNYLMFSIIYLLRTMKFGYISCSSYIGTYRSHIASFILSLFKSDTPTKLFSIFHYVLVVNNGRQTINFCKSKYSEL